MKISNVPTKMGVVFGVNGQRQDLLADAASGEPNASYNAGFPPITMIAKSAGGQAPLGKDFNQIFYELSADAQWSQASGVYPYDATFSTAIGGYPKGAVVIGTDNQTLYQNTVDDNTVSPGTDSTWKIVPNDISKLVTKNELSSDSGSSLIGAKSSGTLADQEVVVWVESFIESSDGEDIAPAIRRARDYAVKNGLSLVMFDGNYTVSSTEGTWVMPFDDGTVDPSRPTSGSLADSSLTSESQTTMAVAINWPSNLTLKANDYWNNSLSFNWDGSTVNISQLIGFCLRVVNWDGTYLASSTAVNRMNTTVQASNLGGFTIKGCFIPVVIDGVITRYDWGVMRFQNCGFGVLAQGNDIGTIKGLIFNVVQSGFISGGWWLTRNDLRGNGGVNTPPYVASNDAYAAGWADFACIATIQHDGMGSYGTLAKNIDSFFDTYFWKSANNSTRLTKTGPDLKTASVLAANNPYRGVAHRSHCPVSRYDRGNNNNVVYNMKNYGNCRPPIWTNPYYASSYSTQHTPIYVVNAYMERVGKVVASGSNTPGGSNDFFKSGVDTYNSDLTQLPYVVGQGPVHVDLFSNINSIGVYSSAYGNGDTSPQINVISGQNVWSNILRQTKILTSDAYLTDAIEELTRNYYLVPQIKYDRTSGVLAYGNFTVSSGSYGFYAGVPSSASDAASKLVTLTVNKFCVSRVGYETRVMIDFTVPSDISSISSSQFSFGCQSWLNVSSTDSSESSNASKVIRNSICTVNVVNGAGVVINSYTSADSTPLTFSIQSLPKIALISHGNTDGSGSYFRQIFSLFKDNAQASKFTWGDMVAGKSVSMEIIYDSQLSSSL